MSTPMFRYSTDPEGHHVTVTVPEVAVKAARFARRRPGLVAAGLIALWFIDPRLSGQERVGRISWTGAPPPSTRLTFGGAPGWSGGTGWSAPLPGSASGGASGQEAWNNVMSDTRTFDDHIRQGIDESAALRGADQAADAADGSVSHHQSQS